jgi:hypothetical protein
MSLEELRGVDIEKLNTVERLQVKKLIETLEREEGRSAEVAQLWYQKWSFWVGFAALLVALISIALGFIAVP